VGDLGKIEAASLARHIYTGSHIQQSGVSATRGSEVVAEPLVVNQEVLIDLDGETPGRLPLVARIAPAALSIRI
jgi:diacylglycerol kinase family enzyme